MNMNLVKNAGAIVIGLMIGAGVNMAII